MMEAFNDNENISMNISTGGTNVFQYGRNIVEFSISPFGGIENISGYQPTVDRVLTGTERRPSMLFSPGITAICTGILMRMF
jgi:hypothetical protein